MQKMPWLVAWVVFVVIGWGLLAGAAESLKPVVLIFVVDEARMGRRSESDKVFYAATDTWFVSQNIYLYCASEGLATVVIGMVDKPALAAKMKLRSEQKVVLSQPVCYPAK